MCGVLPEYMQIYVLNSQCVISLDNVCLSVGEWPSVLALWRGTWCVMASLYITSSRFRFPYTVLSCVHRDRGPRQMSLSLPNMHSNSGVKAKRTAHAHPPSQVWAHCCWTHTQSYFKYIHKPAMCNRRRQQRPEVFLHVSAVLAGRCIMADGQHVPESIVSLSLLFYTAYTIPILSALRLQFTWTRCGEAWNVTRQKALIESLIESTSSSSSPPIYR
jgi:hypothetical protein